MIRVEKVDKDVVERLRSRTVNRQFFEIVILFKPVK